MHSQDKIAINVVKRYDSNPYIHSGLPHVSRQVKRPKLIRQQIGREKL